MKSLTNVWKALENAFLVFTTIWPVGNGRSVRRTIWVPGRAAIIGLGILRADKEELTVGADGSERCYDSPDAGGAGTESSFSTQVSQEIWRKRDPTIMKSASPYSKAAIPTKIELVQLVS
jgi:hypothetical protein